MTLQTLQTLPLHVRTDEPAPARWLTDRRTHRLLGAARPGSRLASGGDVLPATTLAAATGRASGWHRDPRPARPGQKP